MLKAKFRCQCITTYESGQEVTLDAVYGEYGNGNENWSKATPSGHLKMTVTNPDAYDQIKVGKEYYLTIEECPK